MKPQMNADKRQQIVMRLISLTLSRLQRLSVEITAERWLLGLLWVIPSASAEAATPGGEAGSPLLTLVVSLFIVLAAIVLVAFITKRFAPGHLLQNPYLRVVSQTPLGPREKIAIVEVGEQWLVVGITGHSITPLMQTTKQPLPTDAQDSAPHSFSKLLATAWGKREK